MKVHFCPLDRECREFDPPWRLHINTDRWHFAVAVRPRSKFAYIDRPDRWVMFQRWPEGYMKDIRTRAREKK